MPSGVQGFPPDGRLPCSKTEKPEANGVCLDSTPGHPRGKSVHKAMWAEETWASVCYNDAPKVLVTGHQLAMILKM